MPVRAIEIRGGWVEADSLADLEAYAGQEAWLRERLGRPPLPGRAPADMFKL